MRRQTRSGVLRILGLTGWTAAVWATAASADTYSFGYYDEETGFAVLGESWTFDHGAADPLEGWRREQTPAAGPAFRHIDAAGWASGGNPVEAPILAGQGSAWVGLFQSDADELCWAGRLGYGNDWTQRLVSPELGWTGTGDVSLHFLYFSDIESFFDHTRVLLRLDDGSETSINGDGFTGQEGISGGEVEGAPFDRIVTAAELEGTSTFQIVFEMTSDAGFSDEDGGFDSVFGPFGVDDVSLTGALTSGDVLFTFESDLEGWTAESDGPPPALTELGVAPVSDYPLPDPCGLEGNVMELHDDTLGHPPNQFERILSNPVLLTGLGDVTDIRLEFEMMTGNTPAVYRTGFRYYPVPCAETGGSTWETRMDPTYLFLSDEGCIHYSYSALEEGFPEGVEQVEAVIELLGSFPMQGDDGEKRTRSGSTAFAPLFDAISVVVESSDPAHVDLESRVGAPILRSLEPNPFSGETTITLSTPLPGRVRLQIVDVAGRVVAALHDGTLDTQQREFVWDGEDRRGRPVPSGVYWARLAMGDQIDRARLVLTR